MRVVDGLAVALTAPVAVAAALLVLAGAPKAVAPQDTARALVRMGLPSAGWLVRLGGGAEVALGLVVLTVGGVIPTALVAASYLAFCAVVVRALVSGDPLSSCGCLGRPDTPPTRTHVVVVAALAAACAAAAAGPAPPLLAAVTDAPGTGLPLLLAVGVSTALAWLGLAVLPVLSAPTPTVRTLPLVDAAQEARS